MAYPDAAPITPLKLIEAQARQVTAAWDTIVTGGWRRALGAVA
jgi:hypothetical protein